MNNIPSQPLVSIGLPVYNRPKLLYKALENLTRQTYRNIEIIISDDHSPGNETQNVIKAFSEKDSRIRCYRLKQNIGGYPNHRFVFEQANGEYFFWASEDDEWHEEFIETGVKSLLTNTYYHAWCCTPVNIDSLGRISRKYSGFSRFTSTHNKRKDIINYLFEPESFGKANIFHGIYRRDALSETIRRYFPQNNPWYDHCFIFAFLIRYKLIATDEILFYKRLVRPYEDKRHVNPIIVGRADRHVHIKASLKYIHEFYKISKNTPYQILVPTVMALRLPFIFINSFGLLLNGILGRFGYAVIKIKKPIPK